METANETSMEQGILEAAEELFLEKGLALTSTTEIAKKAGCNQALVHYYFRTKENLFNTIFQKKFNAFFSSIFETQKLTKLTFEEKIERIVTSHFELLNNNPKLPLLVINEFTRRPEEIEKIKNKMKDIPIQYISSINAELEAEIKAGRIRQGITLFEIVLTMISLNISLFVLLPIASNVISLSEEQAKELTQKRKNEHVRIILTALKP